MEALPGRVRRRTRRRRAGHARVHGRYRGAEVVRVLGESVGKDTCNGVGNVRCAGDGADVWRRRLRVLNEDVHWSFADERRPAGDALPKSTVASE